MSKKKKRRNIIVCNSNQFVLHCKQGCSLKRLFSDDVWGRIVCREIHGVQGVSARSARTMECNYGEFNQIRLVLERGFFSNVRTTIVSLAETSRRS
jgi:hypothetical protein